MASLSPIDVTVLWGIQIAIALGLVCGINMMQRKPALGKRDLAIVLFAMCLAQVFINWLRR